MYSLAINEAVRQKNFHRNASFRKISLRLWQIVCWRRRTLVGLDRKRKKDVG
jgi:hypothetical protein